MKGYLLFAFVLLLMPIGLVKPFFGMMFYNWFALFKPEWFMLAILMLSARR